MSFNSNLLQGQELSNQEIVKIFQCGNQGGVLRNTIQIVLFLIHIIEV